MKNIFFKSIALFTFILCISKTAVPQGSGVALTVIVNGGIFEFSPPYVDYVTLNLRHTYYGDLGIADTIYTQSAQDILVDGENFYVAAADSIIMYNHVSQSLTINRVKSAAFGAPSTIKMLSYKNYLIVGNWYGSADNNLRIFNKNSLEFIDSIPQIKYGAKDFVIYKDSLFIQQNLSSNSFQDSAGFLSVVDLNSLQFIRNIELNNQGTDLGRLLIKGDSLMSLNSNSNTSTIYNLTNGLSNNVVINGDVQVGPYGQQFAKVNNTLYLKTDGSIKKLDLDNVILDTATIIDTVTAFIYDSLQRQFVVTKTDFGSYSFGSVHSLNGGLYENFSCGYAPEVIGGIYGLWEGIQENKSLPMTVYPNPFINSINLELANSSGELIIYNLQGAVVYSNPELSGKVKIELENIPTGMYRAVFYSNGQVFSSKIVKTK